MRYIRPPDFKSVRELGEVYKKVEKDIFDLLATDGSASTVKELNQKLGQAIGIAMTHLSSVNKEYTTKELATAFKEGQDQVKEDKKLTNAEVSAILEKQGFKYAKNGFSRDTYIELQTATESAGKGLKKRVNSIIGELAKTGQDTVYNVQQAILKDLEVNEVLEIKYSNGAKMPLSAYATMAARSARIESTNIGEIGRALQSGTDLVEMTTMPQCCKLCGAYQGKVYSISGKDKRFPALFKTVLKNGYALPHPNCRHEFIPFYEEMEDPEDVEKAIAKSKIKYDSKGNLVDVRYQKDIEAYQSWQAGNRQLNREMHEFEQMQAYYERKGLDAPYKTLAAFRRARRNNNLSPAFKEWRYRSITERQYKEWVKKIGQKNMPETFDKFFEIKHNNTKEYQQIVRDIDLHRQYKEAVKNGKVDDVGFVVFKDTLEKARKRLVGIKVNGSTIKEVSIHLIERIIGSEKEKRQGVLIEKVALTLEKGVLVKEKIDKQGRRGWTFHLDGVDVSYNPDKKMVVQCQPNTHRKV